MTELVSDLHRVVMIPEGYSFVQSGAGKTETTKACMRLLTTVTEQRAVPPSHAAAATVGWLNRHSWPMNMTDSFRSKAPESCAPIRVTP
jgi:hypothetical protein